MNWPIWSTSPPELQKIKNRFLAKSRAKRRLVFWSVIFGASLLAVIEVCGCFGCFAPMFILDYWLEMFPLL